jgi:hypothetical protein
MLFHRQRERPARVSRNLLGFKIYFSNQHLARAGSSRQRVFKRMNASASVPLVSHATYWDLKFTFPINIWHELEARANVFSKE